MLLMLKQKRHILFIIFSIFVIFYFCYHLTHGVYRIYAVHELREELALLKVHKKQLEEERLILEKRCNLLRDGSLEKDMLDEYARKNLNFSLSNELTLMLSNS
ncbi:MAG: Septum formation initiator [Candidatus Tokpelaia sp. JSC161]|jgi:cell division protein FtsB|nr:MAG: Septum formation initiator [Candidatus Tokpelaia sp. JSC161]